MYCLITYDLFLFWRGPVATEEAKRKHEEGMKCLRASFSGMEDDIEV